MSKHVAAVLADLRTRSQQLALERADIDEAIATLEKMNGGPPAAPPPQRKPSGGRREKAPARRPADGGSDRDARKEKAREQYEAGEDTKVIAREAGVSAASIYLWAKTGKWERPATTAAAKPKGEQLAGRVRCPKCETMTSMDPCDGCGTKLPRKGF